MTLPSDPRADPFIDREPAVSGARFAHLFVNATTFREIDEVWRSVGAAGRWTDSDEALEAALERSRDLRADGAEITASTGDVWEEWALTQNDVELVAYLAWSLDVDFGMPREMEQAIRHHANLRRSQLLAAGVVTGPSPF